MSPEPMQGVYPILITPFDARSRVDVEGLRSVVDFQIASGVHGIGIALGSEIVKLSEEERGLVTRTVVDQAKGRVPVVVNTGAAGTDLALLYSQRAQDDGADALMVMPPTFSPVGGAEMREYFRALSAAVRLPIFIQDTSTAHVSADLAKQIADECEHVRYIKVESLPTPVMVADTVAKAGDTLVVFGGAGGNYFIEEMRRGSQGTMPSCSQPEAYVQVWDRFHAGDAAGAEEVFYRLILPLNRIAATTWGAFFHVNKEVLRHRGVIASALVRGPIAPLDEVTRRELAATLEELYPN